MLSGEFCTVDTKSCSGFDALSAYVLILPYVYVLILIFDNGCRGFEAEAEN